ncbi:hypothetical protein [uncultured Thiohalocapsa sp.]|uniref:hypothetical protein n=1 Tax=uncultured Thiohalocapsa sp. TaxID=768990 RepID=UPI0025F8CCA6|nr:hypothetical protein [uncultured Thiohalocapsa sp.]
MNSLAQYTQALRPRADALCTALRREAERLFGADIAAGCTPDTAVYRLQRDPAAGADSLVGEWQDARGHPIGMLVFHPDGSCFGEYDIVRMHPRDKRWFVEAVEAWAGAADAGPDAGSQTGDAAGTVRADVRLLAAP